MSKYLNALNSLKKYPIEDMTFSRQCGKVTLVTALINHLGNCRVVVVMYRRESYKKYKIKKGRK